MVDLLSGLIRIPALGPDNGGQGERAKADWLAEYCKMHGLEVTEYAAPDDRVESGGRPNLVVRVPGRTGGRTLWVMSHLDVVPPGAEKDWSTPPFEPTLKDGRLYGRGSEDNGQSLAAAFWALKSLEEEGRQPGLDVGLLFVADEETGSGKGITWLLDEHEDLFTAKDVIFVPDGGDEAGAKIEVTEKTLLWIKFTVHGRQCHGSMPYLGNNAARAAAHAVVAVDEALHQTFPATEQLFNPPESTFEPTRHDANVPNINTIPGREVFHFDCRVLPAYDSGAVLATATEAAAKTVEAFGCTVDVETVMHDKAAPSTPTDAEVVVRLQRALAETRGIKAEPWGVGGGTVAAIFRRRGYEAAVWSTYEECAHAPDEFAVVDNMVADAKVYAHLFTQDADLGRA
jgi:succinyl-diaminopimelate desuccinylase